MDIICFSHLRWNFVYQRPQQIMGRLAQHFRVFYVEEPVYNSEDCFLETTMSKEGVWVIVPHLTVGEEGNWSNMKLKEMLKESFKYFELRDFIIWYYTPMALPRSVLFVKAHRI